MFKLQADKQNGNGCRARDEAASKTKQHNLPGGDFLAFEAAVDLFGVCALVGILPVCINQIVMIVVMMMLMTVVMIVIMSVVMIVAVVRMLVVMIVRPA